MKPDRGSRGQTGMLNQQVQLRWNDLLHSRRCRCSSRAVIWPARNCQIRSRLYLVSLVFGKVPIGVVTYWFVFNIINIVCFQLTENRPLPGGLWLTSLTLELSQRSNGVSVPSGSHSSLYAAIGDWPGGSSCDYARSLIVTKRIAGPYDHGADRGSNFPG